MLEPYRGEIIAKIGELVGETGMLLFSAFSATTRATARFVFNLLVLLYSMDLLPDRGPDAAAVGVGGARCRI